MRKTIAILLGFVLTMAISTTMITPAKADISSIEWIAPILQGTDSFYNDIVVAYETGTDWSLAVNVYGSNASRPLNVSRIKVWFDWGVNYTYTYSYPLSQVPSGEYRVFSVSNTTPATTTASNLFPHRYTVYVEHAKNTSTRELAYASFSYSWNSPPGTSNDFKFAVYSADQKAAVSSADRYDDLATAYAGYTWTGAEAISLRAQATLENSRGDDYYNRGDFANAKTSYSNAVSKFEQAIAAQDEWASSSQEVTLNNTKATGTATLTNANANMKLAEAAEIEANAAMIEANATKVQADAALTNAYGWYFIGIGFAIGWTLMGIGVVIYTLRKPKPPTT